MLIGLNASVVELFNRTLKTYQITSLQELLLKCLQCQEDHIDNAFLGEIPKRIAICMMDNNSCNGNYKKNPFDFQHYNLTQIRISVNEEEVPFKALKLNFDDKLIVIAYNTLFSGTGKLYGNSGSIIKREDYSEGSHHNLFNTLCVYHTRNNKKN